MLVRKILAAAVLAASVTLLGGCDVNVDEVLDMLQPEKWEPQESAAISIDEEGMITEIIQEKLDAAYYDAAELQNMINTEVADYNSKYGENSITIETYEAAEGAVKLVMEYASAEDYGRFNNIEFYYGSMINAQLEGYLFDVSYKKVRDGVVQGSAVSGSDVIMNMADTVMVVRAPLEIKVPGEVRYTSTNAEVLGKDVVNATGKQEEKADEGLVLPSNAVFREKEATFEEQAAANRVYIIFEDY